MVATAVIFSSALPAMFGTFVKHRFQRTYDAILAAPVDVEELVTGEMLWIGLRAGVFGCFPLLVTIGFGLDPAPGMLLVPFFCLITALGFAGFGIAVAASVAKIDQFNYVTTLVHHAAVPRRRHLLPDRPAARVGAGRGPAQPAPPARDLVRGACFGFDPVDLLRLAGLIALAAAMWRLAIDRLKKRLID